MTEAELFDGSPASVRQALRDLFAEMGSPSTREVWIEAERRGIIPSEMIARMAINGGAALVKKALKELVGPEGQQFAAPLSNEVNAQWKQTALFEESEHRDLLIREHTGIEHDLEKLQRKSQYHEARYGREVQLPLLSALELTQG